MPYNMDNNVSTESQSPDIPNPGKPNKRKGNYKPANKRINTDQAIKQRYDKGMSLTEIGACQGVSKQAVSKVLQKVTNIDVLNAFKSKRADVYAALEHEILNTVDDETIKSSSLLQRITAAGILKTHENIETGKGQGDLSSIDIRLLISHIPVDNSQSDAIINVHNVDDIGK